MTELMFNDIAERDKGVKPSLRANRLKSLGIALAVFLPTVMPTLGADGAMATGSYSKADAVSIPVEAVTDKFPDNTVPIGPLFEISRIETVAVPAEKAKDDVILVTQSKEFKVTPADLARANREFCYATSSDPVKQRSVGQDNEALHASVIHFNAWRAGQAGKGITPDNTALDSAFVTIYQTVAANTPSDPAFDRIVDDKSTLLDINYEANVKKLESKLDSDSPSL